MQWLTSKKGDKLVALAGGNPSRFSTHADADVNAKFPHMATFGEAEFAGLKNYITLWNTPNFRESLGVTLRFAFFCVTIEMVIGVGLALLLDRNIRGMSVLRTMFILQMMIAPDVVGLMWRYMYHPSVGTFNRLLESIGLPDVDWLGSHALTSVIIADI